MDFQTAALVAVASVSGLILAGLGFLVKKLTDKLRADTKHTLAMGALARITDAAFATVKAVTQVMADDIRQKAADGKLTDAEKKELSATALNTLKKSLGDQFLSAAGDVLQIGSDSMNELLGVKLEAAVHDIKAVSGSQATSPAGK